MQSSFGSAEQPVQPSADSNAKLWHDDLLRRQREYKALVRRQLIGSEEQEDSQLEAWCANIERIFRKPLWRDLILSSAEQPALSLQSNVKMAAAALNYKSASLPAVSASNSAHPASDSIASQLPEAILPAIVQFVGAHNLETIWECSACNPYWYDWYCHDCELVNKFLYWSHRTHFGYCGLCCGCCRSAEGKSGCEACDELWNLKATCQPMRDQVRKFSGN